MPLTWYTLVGYGPAVGSWSDTGLVGVATQTPYWIGPVTNVAGAGFKDGFVCAFHLQFGGGYIAGEVVPCPMPNRILRIRLTVARTGPVDPAVSILVGVWRYPAGIGPTTDFSSIPPDGIATIPLSSLVLVDPARNYQPFGNDPLNYQFPFVDVAFAGPIPVAMSGPEQIITAIYLSSGFTATSNVVIGQGDGLQSDAAWTGDSLVYGGPPDPSIPGWHLWVDQPHDSIHAVQVGSAYGGKFPGVQWGMENPTAGAVAHSYAQIVGG